LCSQGKILRVKITGEQGLLHGCRAPPRHQFDEHCGLLWRQRQFELDLDWMGRIHIIVMFGIRLPFIIEAHHKY
jgi:hypothetical protein